MSFLGLLQNLNSNSGLNLQIKINDYLQSHITCSKVLILIISDVTDEGVIQVIGNTVLPDEIRFFIKKSIYDDQAFSMGKKNHDDTKIQLNIILRDLLKPFPDRLMQVPIRHPEKNDFTCFIVHIIDPTFKEEHDEQKYTVFIRDCFSVCSAVLLNAFNLMEERKRVELYQRLLNTAKEYLFRIDDYNILIKGILAEARIITNSERCALFLVTEDRSELVANIFDGVPPDFIAEIRIPITEGLAGFVVRTGEVVNVDHAYNHPLFYKRVDEITGFKTRNVLCFPIFNEADQVIGAVHISNKKNGRGFTFHDEEAAYTFGIYIGIVLVHGVVHKTLQVTKAQNRLRAELISHHMRSPEDDYANILNCESNKEYAEMLNYKWPSRSVSNSEKLCYVVGMFENLGFTKHWKISRKTLASFILSVRKNYRDLPYHNWSHAFSVSHFSYYLMVTLQLPAKSVITDLEGLAFLVSALCHDLDHRGTTNSFQVFSGSTMARLYSSEGSIMERHHFSLTLSILNTEGCNIFENLTVDQYKRILYVICDLIVATDLYEHVGILPEERKMAKKGYIPSKKAHRQLLLALMMTCCDLNDQVKGWKYCRDVARSIYTEFFKQGDMEKKMGKTPLKMMDREIAFVPKLQLEFLREICRPCFTVLSMIFPTVKDLVESIKSTEVCWEMTIQWFEANNIPVSESIDLIFDPDLENYLFKERDEET